MTVATQTLEDQLDALIAEHGHTHLPWRYAEIRRPPMGLGPHDTDALGNISWGYSLSGSNENGTAILPTLGAVHNFPGTTEANASFIVRACNSHYELIEACENLLLLVQDADASPICRLARAAILKATGK
jgi:hypothetical protein